MELDLEWRIYNALFVFAPIIPSLLQLQNIEGCSFIVISLLLIHLTMYLPNWLAMMHDLHVSTDDLCHLSQLICSHVGRNWFFVIFANPFLTNKPPLLLSTWTPRAFASTIADVKTVNVPWSLCHPVVDFSGSFLLEWKIVQQP